MSVRKNDKTGKWIVDFYYTDYQGKRYRKKKEGFTLARDAKAWEREFLDKQAGSIKMTFKALVDEYMQDCQKRLKPTTMVAKWGVINNNLLPTFANIPINEITPLTVRKFQNSIIERYSNQLTQKYIDSQLSAVLNYAVRFYNLPFNPASRAGSIGRLKAKENICYWTLEEFNAFIECLRKPIKKSQKTDMYYMAFNILFFCGLRIGELLALSVGDYDKQAQTLSINKNLVRIKGVDVEQSPKTRKSKRIITLPAFLCDMLDDYILKLYEPLPTDRMFLDLKRSNLGQTLQAQAKRAGLQEITLHDLRHSHASMLVNMDVNPLAISERLGHEDIKTTLNIYSHLYKNKAKEIADKINKMVQF